MRVHVSTLVVAAQFLCSPAVGLSATDLPPDTPVSQLLEAAQAHLSSGRTNDALVYFDAAIARDPSNYLSLFKRATVYLSQGRTSQATDDFTNVLSLKPGFQGAHLQLAKIKARVADWDGAHEQYRLAGKSASSPEVLELAGAKTAARSAEAASTRGAWEECVDQASTAIAVASRAVSLRALRAQCRFERSELGAGLSDLRHIQTLQPGDTTSHVKTAAIAFYALHDVEAGMTALRGCLHSDPESKLCKKHYREQKAVDKALQKVIKTLEKNQPMGAARQLVENAGGEGLINQVNKTIAALKQDGFFPHSAQSDLVIKLVELACQAYYEANGKKSGHWCPEALRLNEKSLYGLLHRAKLQFDAEDFEDSVRILEQAAEIHTDKHDKINPPLQEARIALKRSLNKDYYKVLGVGRDADERQIKAAYRKVSKQHHPDKAARLGLSKEAAEKKMASINEAYEVLSNPELRARFDRGDDPNSHEHQHQQQSPFTGHPFFQSGGGGGGDSHWGSYKWASGGFPGGFQFG